jgi:hypothetical protein
MKRRFVGLVSIAAATLLVAGMLPASVGAAAARTETWSESWAYAGAVLDLPDGAYRHLGIRTGAAERKSVVPGQKPTVDSDQVFIISAWDYYPAENITRAIILNYRPYNPRIDTKLTRARVSGTFLADAYEWTGSWDEPVGPVSWSAAPIHVDLTWAGMGTLTSDSSSGTKTDDGGLTWFERSTESKRWDAVVSGSVHFGHDESTVTGDEFTWGQLTSSTGSRTLVR